MVRLKIFIALFLAVFIFAHSQAQVLIETESFENKGGWLPDHQAFEKIASSYLIANGMGIPVEDASTTVSFKKAGSYYVYVHTYNWTAPWYAGEGPGGFQLLVNGEIMPNELGDTGNNWEWQLAG